MPTWRRWCEGGGSAAVAAYVLILAACALTAAGTASVTVALGAALFFASDAVLARQRFGRPRPHSDLVVSVTYLLAQTFIVGGSALR